MKTLRILSLALLPGFAASGLASEVAYWSFDEGNGALIGDHSGNSNNGQLFNKLSSTWADGKFGNCMYFPGVVGQNSTRVEVQDSPSLRLTNSGSFAAWLWSEDIYRDAPVFAKEGGGGLLSYWFGTFGPSGAGHWGVLMDQDGWQGWDFNGRDQGYAPGGQWTHIATSWDGQAIRYFLNGQLVNTKTWGGSIHVSTARLFLGTNAEYTFASNATAFKGKVDEVHIFNHAISANDVLNLFNTAVATGTVTLRDTVSALAAPRVLSYNVWLGTELVQSGGVAVSNATQEVSFCLPVTRTGLARIEWNGGPYLRKSQTLMLPGSNFSLGTILLTNGDVDDSGEVDAVDIDEVIAQFGSVEPINADVDSSGEVDAVDIDIVIANFGAVDE